ncbi:MAG: hypothetical protein ABI232_11175 [Jatrophihabitantaceae bacterium]
MARALLGYVGSSNEQALTIEVNRLRRRVAELETEVRELRAHDHVELDLEFHRITEEASPVLT